MRLVDVHSHIHIIENVEEIVSRALDVGVIAIITSSEGDDYEKALNVARKFDNVFASIGLHPTKADNSSLVEKVIEFIEEHKEEIIAVGEVGLDYYRIRDDDKRKIQQEVFRRFIELAIDLDKPLVIHSRSAGKYCIEILAEYKPKRVVMHAFDGNYKYAKRGAMLGFKFSIPPSIVRSQQKKNLVKALPLNALLLESDAPALAPKKGEPNEPANIIYSLEAIAEIKRMPKEDVAEILRKNTLEIFPELEYINRDI